MNITNLVGNWLNGIGKKTKERIRVGVCALVWTIWNFRNEVVFNKCANPNFLQVIHRAASLIHLWSYLLPIEQREPLDTGCNRLMAVVWTIFNKGGWLHSRYIGDVA
jgi:two-component response regulator (ARR-B family)